MGYLTLAQAARRRGCSLQTIHNHVARGWLKAERPAGSRGLMIDEAELVRVGFITPAPTFSSVSPEIVAELAQCGFEPDAIAGLATADTQTLRLIVAIVRVVLLRCSQTPEKGN